MRAWGVHLKGDTFGGEFDGFDLVLKIMQQPRTDCLQSAATRKTEVKANLPTEG